MNLPVAEFDDRVDARATRRFREVNSVSGSSTVVSEGSSSIVDAVKAVLEMGCGERDEKAIWWDFIASAEEDWTKSRAARAAAERWCFMLDYCLFVCTSVVLKCVRVLWTSIELFSTAPTSHVCES